MSSGGVNELPGTSGGDRTVNTSPPRDNHVTESSGGANTVTESPTADHTVILSRDPPRYPERRQSWLTEDIPDDDDDDDLSDDSIILPILPLELAVVCCVMNFILPGVGMRIMYYESWILCVRLNCHSLDIYSSTDLSNIHVSRSTSNITVDHHLIMRIRFSIDEHKLDNY